MNSTPQCNKCGRLTSYVAMFDTYLCEKCDEDTLARNMRLEQEIGRNV